MKVIEAGDKIAAALLEALPDIAREYEEAASAIMQGMEHYSEESEGGSEGGMRGLFAVLGKKMDERWSCF